MSPRILSSPKGACAIFFARDGQVEFMAARFPCLVRIPWVLDRAGNGLQSSKAALLL